MESYRYAYKVVILDSQLAEHRQSDIQDAPTELASLRADVDALSDELLNRYEEVTLLYDLSRELGVVLDVESASSTALVRTLEVIPARWGIVVVGGGTESLVPVATAGTDRSDGRYAAVAGAAAAVAVRRGAQVMVHTGV